MKVSIQGNKVIAVSDSHEDAQTLLALMFNDPVREKVHKKRTSNARYTQVPKDRMDEYARKAAAMYNEGIKVPRIAEALSLTPSNTYLYIKKGGAVVGHPVPALNK